ncbi:hypothetical protein [Flavobacterium ustbae]|uniref:hypothetical protein n=1 Tax=Flavobacterium ustbae TaxID=2488790 RepID=UPI000F7A3917|nr:hypothetical protein [Flavobacterium ustbae]
MEEKRTQIDDILIIQQGDDVLEFINSINNASLHIYNAGVLYSDPFGNSMISYRAAIVKNEKVYSFKQRGDIIDDHDGITIFLPNEEILEIANKTFYKDGQAHSIDFKNL